MAADRWRRPARFCALLLGLAIGGPSSAAGDVPLVEQGAARAAIVKSADASEVVNFAASELQRYLRKISGAELAIRPRAPEAGSAIVLETARLAPPRNGLECDRFAIKTGSERVLLTGNTDRAVLYAVYTLLETLGAAWLEPGEQGEILPRNPTLRVPRIDRVFTPAFDLRGMRIYDEGGGEQTVDWMAKTRMNFVLAPKDGLPPKGFEQRGMLLMKGTHHDFALRMGLDPDWHKDPANFQYLAMLGGKRALPRGKDPWYLSNVEPCLSNQEAVEMLVAAAIKSIEDCPAIDILDVRADDILNNWCECEACSRQTATDNYVSYVNQLAAKVHQRWPEKKVSLIAYFDTVFPPRDVLPDASLGNLVLWFAPITRPYRQPIRSVSGGEKTVMEFPRNKAVWPVTDSGWEPILLAWRRLFSGPILILDYYHWSDNAAGRPSYFYMRPGVIAADLRYYHELGLSGSIGVEPCPLQLPNGWNQYLKARLLWDPSQDVAQLERHYDEQSYGDCAAAARDCLSTVAAVLSAERNDADSVQKLREAAARFAAGVKNCEKAPAVEERLQRIALWATYVTLRKEYYHRLYASPADSLKQARTDLADFVQSHRDSLARYCGQVERMVPRDR